MKLLVYALVVVGVLFIASAFLMAMAAKDFEKVTLAADSPCAQPGTGLLPGGFEGHIIALEFARSVCDVELIIGDDNHKNRAVMSRILNLDTYFILSYWLLFSILGFLMTREGSHWAMWLGLAVIICGTGAAFFDFIENSGIRQVVETPLANTTAAMALAIRDATLVKWCLSFVVSLLLAAALIYVNAGGVPRWIGIGSGILLLAGALVGFVGLRYNTLIPKTLLIQAPGLIGVIILSFRWPQVFLWKQ
jgi:hypothetical protein